MLDSTRCILGSYARQEWACTTENVPPEGLAAVVAESGLAALSSEGEGEAAVPVDAPPNVLAVPPDLVGPPTNGAPACIYARMSQDSLTCHCRRVLDACCAAQR